MRAEVHPLAACLLLTLAAASPPAAAGAADPPNAIDYSMFFLSDVRDSRECAVAPGADGGIDFGEAVTNPALTCPDAFAWSAFIEVVSRSFWEDWATDDEMWPTDPWPRCRGKKKDRCCAELAESNDPAPAHCPVFPGATPGMPAHVPQEPSKAHQVSMAEAAVGDADADGLSEWEDVPDVLKTAVIGNEQKELVYRNLEMARYIFDNELYFSEGLARVHRTFSRALAAYAPYRPVPANPAGLGRRPIAAIDLPIPSIMVKVNWLDVELAPRLGIDVEKNAPYIVMNMPPEAGKPPRPFLLLSFHISTKDVPNWLWATFEHVDNQGRCDWTGCNDSFGYRATEAEPRPPRSRGLAPAAGNYTAPHQADDVNGAGVQAFAIADVYSGVDEITRGLSALFDHFGIGTGEASTGGRPTPGDPAWLSYRLKGSQTDFVTPTGRATRLGNSVTEAGFTNSASCIGCHARAGVDAQGLPPLAIFTNELSDAGLPKSFNGPPVEAWFDVNAYFGVGGQREAPALRAIPADFVWGFRNACPGKPRQIGPSRCANVKSAD